MRRFNGLFARLTEFTNLHRAWLKARKGTGWNFETQRFCFNLERNLLALQRQLADETYRPGPFRFFPIRDPKPRVIAVAPFRDRVVHHALVQVYMPIFEATFIEDSFATRRGKGTHKAIVRAQEFARRNPWYFKFDIEHFFETVDHTIMLALIARKVKDPKILRLTERIIRNTPEPKGLPIGNLTSQFFANIYLNPLDHFVKEVLAVRGYLRYMDDFVLFAEEKAVLQDFHVRICDFVNMRLKLKLKDRACWLNRSRAGLSFLGMRIFPGMLRHRPENRSRSLKKMSRRLKAFERGAISEQKLADSLRSLCAHLHHF